MTFAEATSLHGECAAQIMLQDMKAKDAKRVEDRTKTVEVQHGTAVHKATGYS